MISHDRLLEVVKYDPDTGEFTWVKTHGKVKEGCAAGGYLSDGYKGIRLDGHLYRSHRLAWFYVHREWPKIIDHINHDICDNRICNLRNVGQHENTHNPSKLPKGVYRRAAGQYRARIRVGNGKVKHLGTYKTFEEAHAVYVLAKRAMFSV